MHIMWGSRGFVRNKVSDLSFQCPCDRLAHNPKKALQTKVTEIKGRDKKKKAIQTKAEGYV